MHWKPQKAHKVLCFSFTIKCNTENPRGEGSLLYLPISVLPVSFLSSWFHSWFLVASAISRVAASLMQFSASASFLQICNLKSFLHLQVSGLPFQDWSVFSLNMEFEEENPFLSPLKNLCLDEKFPVVGNLPPTPLVRYWSLLQHCFSVPGSHKCDYDVTRGGFLQVHTVYGSHRFSDP